MEPDERLPPDEISRRIYERVVAKGTISVGELLLIPGWTPEEVTTALGKLQAGGLVTLTGNYISLSSSGASREQKWGQSAI